MELSNKLPATPSDLSKVTTYQSGVIQSRAHRRLKKEVSSFLAPHNMTMMEWFVIGLVHDSGEKGIRITELAFELQTTLPYLTNVINTLTLKELVLRTEGKDSRSKAIRLTAKAQALYPEIEADLRVQMRQLVYKDITPEDFRVYIKVLYQLAEAHL